MDQEGQRHIPGNTRELWRCLGHASVLIQKGPLSEWQGSPPPWFPAGQPLSGCGSPGRCRRPKAAGLQLVIPLTQPVSEGDRQSPSLRLFGDVVCLEDTAQASLHGAASTLQFILLGTSSPQTPWQLKPVLLAFSGGGGGGAVQSPANRSMFPPLHLAKM